MCLIMLLTLAVFNVSMNKQCPTGSDSYSTLYFHKLFLLQNLVKLFHVLNHIALPIKVFQEKLKVTEGYILLLDLTTKGTLQAKKGNAKNARLTLH